MSEIQFEDNEIQFEVIHNPINLSELEITPGFLIRFPHSQPNRWTRFWHRFFFGFEWKDLTKDET